MARTKHWRGRGSRSGRGRGRGRPTRYARQHFPEPGGVRRASQSASDSDNPAINSDDSTSSARPAVPAGEAPSADAEPSPPRWQPTAHLPSADTAEFNRVTSALPTHTWTDKDVAAAAARGGSACCVCLNDYAAGDNVSTLPCFDLLHTKCAELHFLHSPTRRVCPYCRLPIDVAAADRLLGPAASARSAAAPAARAAQGQGLMASGQQLVASGQRLSASGATLQPTRRGLPSPRAGRDRRQGHGYGSSSSDSGSSSHGELAGDSSGMRRNPFHTQPDELAAIPLCDGVTGPPIHRLAVWQAGWRGQLREWDTSGQQRMAEQANQGRRARAAAATHDTRPGRDARGEDAAAARGRAAARPDSSAGDATDRVRIPQFSIGGALIVGCHAVVRTLGGSHGRASWGVAISRPEPDTRGSTPPPDPTARFHEEVTSRLMEVGRGRVNNTTDPDLLEMTEFRNPNAVSHGEAELFALIKALKVAAARNPEVLHLALPSFRLLQQMFPVGRPKWECSDPYMEALRNEGWRILRDDLQTNHVTAHLRSDPMLDPCVAAFADEASSQALAAEERMAATDQDSWRKRELLSAHSWPSAAGDATHMQRHDPARRHRPRPETDAAQALRAPKRSRR